MVKTAAETAQDILRKNNEKEVEEPSGMSPNSRQSLRQASERSKTKTTEPTLKSTPSGTVHDRKRSQGKKKSPNAKNDKDKRAPSKARTEVGGGGQTHAGK